MEQSKLQVTMLGDFAITYEGSTVKLERTNTTKAVQALQLLLYHGDNGVLRDTLLDSLYHDDSAAEPTNNLKVTLSNLRKLLAASGLPDGTTVVYRSGSYYWKSSAELDIDIRSFEKEEKLSRVVEGEAQVQAWIRACQLYKGDFLPHLQSESWAAAAAAHYREMYFACVRKLVATLTTAEGAEALLPIVTRAAALYGLEEFQLARIDCMMRLQRFNEAKQVYEDTVRGLRDDFDLGPSEALLQRCRQLDGMISERGVSIQELQDTLREEKKESGAYYCAFPGFIDAYRAVERIIQRSGQSAYLVLCCLTDGRGHEVTSKDKLAGAVPKVSQAIRTSLRRGDLYTQPARDRFLILLIGTNRENCSIVTTRIQNNYKKDMAYGVTLSFRLAPVGDVLDLDEFRNKPAWK